MARVDFERLPESGRLWIFAADRPLSPREQDHLLEGVDRFLDQWNAHGLNLTCGRDLRNGRLLLIGVDEDAAGPSGCSIDALVREINRLERELGVVLTDRAPVLFHQHGELQRASREEFARLAARGDVTPATVVIDTTVQRVGDVRAGRWERAAEETWHGRLFFGEHVG